MKKIISTILLVALLSVFAFVGNSYAASLDSISVDVTKEKVLPGENVTVNINFGTPLGSYTFDIAYDNNIFEYVSAEGGTPNDTSDKVRVTFYDSTGGTAPRESMSVTFKAKEGITTSNPTEFSITAEGLANNDASVTYDDITTPIVKNVTVEPNYIDYTFDLAYTGNIIKGQAKEMKLSYSSAMGRYYEHARLVAEATTPGAGTAQLIGIDENSLEHDIIQNGWGDAQGYKIGGANVMQELNLTGTFSEAGEYTITFKLIDRDNSDQTIAERTFNFTVLEEEPATEEENGGTNQGETNQGQNAVGETNNNEQANQVAQNEQTPTTLPKTGSNLYIPIIIVAIGILSSYIYFNKKK